MLSDNIARLKGNIISSCLKAGRNPSEIEIVAVSKGRQIEDIKEVLRCGLSNIGENKVQEALLKYKACDFTAKWHMIGHLQRNKAKEAVGIFDLIHSVDSLILASEISKQAAKIGKIQNVLLEVKTSSEPSKFGFNPGVLLDSLEDISKLNNIKIVGLMTIPPLLLDKEGSRRFFRDLSILREKIKEAGLFDYKLKLSMGMSDDFGVAIEEGSDIIRVGRAIFEENYG